MSSTDNLTVVEEDIAKLKEQLNSQPLSELMQIALLNLLTAKETQRTAIYNQTAPTGKKY